MSYHGNHTVAVLLMFTASRMAAGLRLVWRDSRMGWSRQEAQTRSTQLPMSVMETWATSFFIRVCGARATLVALHAGCLQNGNNSRCWWPTVKRVCGVRARLREDTGSDSKPFICLHPSTTSHSCPRRMALPASRR